MANVNKFIGIGNLTRDPELRFTQKGQGYVKFGLAINRKRGGEEQVLFLECTAFDQEKYKRAETIGKYCEKGSQLYVEGFLQLDQWDDKEGNRRSKISLMVENFQLLQKQRSPA